MFLKDQCQYYIVCSNNIIVISKQLKVVRLRYVLLLVITSFILPISICLAVVVVVSYGVMRLDSDLLSKS